MVWKFSLTLLFCLSIIKSEAQSDGDRSTVIESTSSSFFGGKHAVFEGFFQPDSDYVLTSEYWPMSDFRFFAGADLGLFCSSVALNPGTSSFFGRSLVQDFSILNRNARSTYIFDLQGNLRQSEFSISLSNGN